MLSSTVVYALLAAPLVPLIYALTVFWKWVQKKQRIGATIDRLPGPPREFFFGNLRQVGRDINTRTYTMHLKENGFSCLAVLS